MFSKNKTSTLLILTAAFVLGTVLSFLDLHDSDQTDKLEIQGLLWPNPKQLRHFATVDQHDSIFGLDNLKGHWSFIFFGYTHCPDVCPLTMTVMNTFSQRLHQERPDIKQQIIFVSVDPQRDDSATLKSYMDYFNPEFIGLGGNNAQIQSLASQIGVAYFLDTDDNTDQYQVDHSASIFMIDPQGRLSGILSAPHNPDAIYDKATKIIDFIQYL